MRKFKLSINLILFAILFSIALIPSIFILVPYIKDKMEINKAKRNSIELTNSIFESIKNETEETYITQSFIIDDLNVNLDYRLELTNKFKFNLYFLDTSGMLLAQWDNLITRDLSHLNNYKSLYTNLPINSYLGTEYYIGKSDFNGSEIEEAKSGNIGFTIRNEIIPSSHQYILNTTSYTAVPIIINQEQIGIFLVVYDFDRPIFLFNNLYDLYPIIFSIIFALVLGIVFYFTINKSLITIAKTTNTFASKQGRISNPTIHIRKDKTEISSLKDEFEKLANKINDNMDYLETFSSDVSHELKNPITSIKLTTEFLLSDVDNFDSSSLKPICKEVEYIENLLNEMSKNQILNNETPHIIPFDYKNSLNKIINRVQEKYSSVDISLKLDSNSFVPLFISEEHFLRIFENLLDNAASFASKVSITTTSVDNQFISFIVEDSGKGIDESEYSKIFKRFYSNREDANIKISHSGLGLSTVKTLIELYSGTIEIGKSETLGGAKFTVLLQYSRRTL